MAALSAGHRHFFRPQRSCSALEEFRNRSSSPRSIAVVCCHNQDPSDPPSEGKTKTKKGDERKQMTAAGFAKGFEKMGKEMKEILSPQRKGDWKDVTLMSLSFAVYVYISQKIVCAYFIWMSMPKPQW